MNNSNEIYKERINHVMNYVNNNLDKSFSLKELAAVANFSPYHFHRIFVAVSGESINFFTNRVRLQKAARLLKFSKAPISEVAFNCGYSSPATFSRSFKEYFGISPSVYKNKGIIENSKIRKELFPIRDYLVPMSIEEKEAKFPIEIKELPQRRVAYIRIVDSYREGVVIKAFEYLVKWAKQMNLYSSETFFGMSIDDPMTTPKEKYRYEACITIPDDLEVDANAQIGTMTLPKCKYGSTVVSGDLSLGATAIDFLFNHWLINSPYEPEHQHGLEIFLDKENICDWSHLDLEFCVPIKSLRKY